MKSTFRPKTVAALLALSFVAFTLQAQTPTPAPAGDPFVKGAGVLITRQYKTRPDYVHGAQSGDRQNAKEFLESLGVAFPTGASATFVPSTSTLTVRNTQENLDLVDALVQAQSTSPPTNCVVIFELYALGKDDALSLLESETASAERYQAVLKLTKTGKARLDTLTALTTRSGQKAIVESIDEVRYATDYSHASSKDAPPAPTSFETRNVGTTFEFEPTIGSDNRTIEVSLVPQRVSFLGFREASGGAGHSTVPLPVFITQKLTTSTRLQAGEPHYLGTMSPPSGQSLATGASSSEVWIAFLKVHLPTMAGAEKVQAAQKDTAPAQKRLVEEPAPPLTVSLEYSFYSLDRADAHELLATIPNNDVPWERLQGLLREKQARFEHITTLRTSSGQKTMVEQIQELMYATELDRLQVQVATPTDAAMLEQVETTPGVPGSFNIRNAGITVEVEPTIGPDGQLVDVSHVPQFVTYLGNLNAPAVAKQMPQPLFETRKVTTTQQVVMGRHTFIGTFNPPHADGVNDRVDTGRTWLGFLRCTNAP